jgi:methyl-accepting chemotaxis protein
VHKLRHTAATLMYQTGNVDVLELKEILTGTSETMEHMNETIKEGNDTSKALKEGFFGSDADSSTSTNTNTAKGIYDATFVGTTTNRANIDEASKKIDEDMLIKNASTIKDLGDILNQIKKGVNSLADCVEGAGNGKKLQVYYF